MSHNEGERTDATDGILNIDLTEDNTAWNFFGKKIPKSELVFFSQVIIIYIIVIVSIINLSASNGEASLWISLIGICTGSILPSPSPSNNMHMIFV